MRNIVKILIVILVTFVAYLIFSISAYQFLVNKGSELADDQCLRVNPVIIDRKNHYLKSVEAIKNNDSASYQLEIVAYLETSKRYVDEQARWLENQFKYINSRSFQFFLPDYMKQAAQIEYGSLKADVESSRFLIRAFEAESPALYQELISQSMELSKTRIELQNEYTQLISTPRKLDWRTRLIKISESKCPSENLDMPNVEELFEPQFNTNSPLS